MTVSAVARLMPRPPARVDSRKQKSWLPSALKCSMAFLLTSPLMLPSSLWKGNLLISRYSEMTSSILTIWLKMSTRWPVSFSLHSSLSMSSILPLPRRIFSSLCSRVEPASLSSGGFTKYPWLQHFQLHHDVDEAHGASLHLLGEGTVVLGQNVFVVLLLELGHVNTENFLHLGWQILLHIFLDPSQDERLEDPVKFDVPLLFRSFTAVLIIEILPVIKFERHDEMEKVPELRETVLQRRTSDQQLVVRVERHEGLIEQALVVLESVRLVNHQTGPVEGAQLGLVLQHDLVGGQQRVELGPPVAGVDPLLGPDDVSARHVADVGQHVPH